jgi:zinc protease
MVHFNGKSKILPGRKTGCIFLALLFWLYLWESPAAAIQSRVETLDNGLKVILVEDHKSPVVVFQIWYRVGSIDERVGKTGTSHLLEHMMFKGTTKIPKGEFSKIVARNGGNENAFTGKDYTAYFQKFSRDRINLSFELESDRMRNLLLDPKEFKLERDVVMEERRMRYEDDPTSAVVENLFAQAFLVHPYQNPVIGWMTDLESLRVEDFRRWYRTYYGPQNAVIVLVGDFDPDQSLIQIRKYFGAIPGGEAPEREKIKESTQRGERRFYIHKEAQLPFVFIGYHVPNIKHPDHYALEVLENILSSGKSSRIYKDLVYEKQIAHYAGGSYENWTYDSQLFYFYGGLKPGKTAEKFESALYRQLKRIADEAVNPQELTKAKNQVEASFILGQDSIFHQAMLVGRLEVIGVDHKYLNTYVENIRKVTAADVTRVAKTYFSKENRTVGILVPEKPQQKSLSK